MNKKTILLIEDDPVLGEVMKKRVEAEGYNCFWEHDGKEGMARLLQSRPDLMLLDIIMPNMNGYEVLETIRADKSLSEIPVIVISNSGQPIEIEKILKLGVKDYIVKAHFSPDEVLEKVKNLIGSGGESDPAVPAPRRAKPPEETKILVMEDEPMLSDIVGTRFKQEHYQVFLASDGETGLTMAKEVHPDAILLDLLMPGTSGFEVLRRLKEDQSLAKVPVIVFSNLVQEREIEECHRLGAADFLVKAKFTPTQIVKRVEAILEKHAK